MKAMRRRIAVHRSDRRAASSGQYLVATTIPGYFVCGEYPSNFGNAESM